MDRPLAAGAACGLLLGLFFISSFFGWPFGADVVAVALVVLLLVVAVTLPAWAPSPKPFRSGLLFGAAAAAVLLVSGIAMAGAGFWSFSPDPVRTAGAVVGILVVLGCLASALGGVAWLGSRARRGHA